MSTFVPVISPGSAPTEYLFECNFSEEPDCSSCCNTQCPGSAAHYALHEAECLESMHQDWLAEQTHRIPEGFEEQSLAEQNGVADYNDA